MSRAKVACPECQDVIISTDDLTILDDDGLYVFRCPRCKASVEKLMDDRIRTLLRTAGVATLDEKVESGSAILADDRAIWRAILCES